MYKKGDDEAMIHNRNSFSKKNFFSRLRDCVSDKSKGAELWGIENKNIYKWSTLFGCKAYNVNILTINERGKLKWRTSRENWGVAGCAKGTSSAGFWPVGNPCSSKIPADNQKVDRKFTSEGIHSPRKRKQVTRGHNIVANGWAGASNPHPHPNPPQTYAKGIKKRSFSHFSTRAHGPTDGQSLL